MSKRLSHFDRAILELDAKIETLKAARQQLIDLKPTPKKVPSATPESPS